ncbi:flagellar hook-associated protein FlgL [Pseudoduganella rhizocola]|uniref:flagellar hook-associated protein FlgL n=1 Tax=Pseudoduganella rhizocola TaxID=3382643 RepID=UPI0038B4E91A
MGMRIATSQMYDTGISQLSTLQANLLKTQMQISTGRRVLTPADDPVASARALEVTQSKELNDQYKLNRQTANSSLSQVDLALGSVGDLLDDVKDTILYAGNPALSTANREALAVDLEGRLQDLLGLANTADGTGGYLFSGYKTNTQPFAATATGANYSGDQGIRELQVGSGRKLPISTSGSAIFENNVTGNGTFLTQADPGNITRGGTGIISPGAVTDASLLTGHDYTIDFSMVDPGDGTPFVLSYAVTDATTGTVLTTPPLPYKAGEPIAFDGVQFDIKGVPKDGDIFTVTPSENQSMFTTIRNVITALRAANNTPEGAAGLTNALSIANQNVTNAQDNALAVRASVGAGLKELEYLDNSGLDINLQYETEISRLIEIDPYEAISRFTQQQSSLDAAQKSFKAASSLSLFNYI